MNHEDSTHLPADADHDPSSSPPPPERIGRYTLIRPLGEGGMGTVYLAEQTLPVERRVALKVIKLGMDTREVVMRFEAERQALAVMDHPGIARVFDGGATDTGRPFFVMEFVQGDPITQFCDRNRLSIPERVVLFVDVCRAVQHAHQKGIVHRDLKPSNVLVARQDGRPVAKIIDFGIAKAIEKPLTDHTFATGAGQFVGTPAYMSPEQLGLTGQDVDTRADIYSLGVLLYELLAGARPFEPRELETGATLADAIRLAEAARPSARLAEVDGDTRHRITQSRQTDAAALQRVLARDLDWIALKAIEKDRSRRYDTANSLAMELQRYLNNEPVNARPPSRSYRMRKFVARHRVGVAAAAAILLLVLASAGVILAQSIRVARERDRAATEAAKATSINEFLQQMLSSADPTGTGNRKVTVVEALAAAERRLDASLGSEPEVAAAVRRTLAITYQGLGELERAEAIIVAAIAASRAAGRQADLVADLAQLADFRRAQGKHGEAERLAREALDLARTTGVEPRQVAEIRFIIAETLRESGNADASLPMATEVLEARRQIFGPDSQKVADSYRQLGALADARGDHARAQAMYRQALDLVRKLHGPQHYASVQVLNDIATTYIVTQEFERALPALEEVTAIQRVVLGDQHPDQATALENLANVLFRLKREREAIAKLEEVLAVRRRAFGDDSLAVARTMFNLGQVYVNIKDLDKAEQTVPEGFARLERALGAKHPDLIVALRGLSALRQAQGRPAEALALMRRSLALALETVGPEHATTATAHYRLGRLLSGGKQYAEAEPHLLAARDTRTRLLGPDVQATKDTIVALVELYEAWGKPEKARALGVATGK
jgi:non-specific serine/threonine protein kinase/serine/threonine-protein kinase